MLWAAKPWDCPGHPASRRGPAMAQAKLSALVPPLVEKNLLPTTTKKQEKWSPDGLLLQGFPEGLTQTSLQASPFPPSLVETFIPIPWTHPPKVHTISEYTSIYSLLLQRHPTVRGCFPLTPAKSGTEVWGWGDGSLPEWIGRQPNGCPVCLTLLWSHSMHSEVAGKHRGSLGFSVFHDDAIARMLWVSLGGTAHTGSHQCRVSLYPTRHFLPALRLEIHSCARYPGVPLVF